DALAGAEQVDVLRRLVAGAVPDFVLLPVAVGPFGVLVPVARLAGEADDDDVLPAVAVEVLGPAAEALAVDVLVAVAVVLAGADLVHLPVGRLVPDLAVDDIQFAVLVDVHDGDALGAEGGVEDGL